MSATVDRLEALGVLQRRSADLTKRLKGARPEHVLRVLCDAGALEGGLSVALDVRPDEAVGALCLAIGGGARRLRIEDVRDRPELELAISLDGLKERWATPDVRALAHNLNDLLRADPEAKVIVELGEWEDALQLWCVPRALLSALWRERFFAPENERQLQLMLVPGS